MQPSWKLRLATPQDIESIVDFNCRIARESENRELKRDLVTRGVTRAFQQGEQATYYVAEADSKLIACLMVTREWSDWRDGWLAWIQSVYVVEAYRGQGVFRTLLEYATHELRKNSDVVGLRLYVENNNHRAQSVYRRSGFTDAHYQVLEKLF